MSQLDYSRAFEALVNCSSNEPIDTKGMLAYALYKHDKRLWTQQWIKEHSSPPSYEDQKRSFEQTSLSPENIKRYKKDANDKLNEVLTGLLNKALEKKEEDIKKELKNDVLAIKNELKEGVKAIKARLTFWGAVWPSLMAGALLLIILFIAWHFFHWYGSGDLTRLLTNS